MAKLCVLMLLAMASATSTRLLTAESESEAEAEAPAAEAEAPAAESEATVGESEAESHSAATSAKSGIAVQPACYCGCDATALWASLPRAHETRPASEAEAETPASSEAEAETPASEAEAESEPSGRRLAAEPEAEAEASVASGEAEGESEALAASGEAEGESEAPAASGEAEGESEAAAQASGERESASEAEAETPASEAEAESEPSGRRLAAEPEAEAEASVASGEAEGESEAPAASGEAEGESETLAAASASGPRSYCPHPTVYSNSTGTPTCDAPVPSSLTSQCPYPFNNTGGSCALAASPVVPTVCTLGSCARGSLCSNGCAEKTPVTVKGYLVDNQCVGLCNGISNGSRCNPSGNSFTNPEKHTVSCLRLAVCVNSGYSIIQRGTDGYFYPIYALDKIGNAEVVKQLGTLPTTHTLAEVELSGIETGQTYVGPRFIPGLIKVLPDPSRKIGVPGQERFSFEKIGLGGKDVKVLSPVLSTLKLTSVPPVEAKAKGNSLQLASLQLDWVIDGTSIIFTAKVPGEKWIGVGFNSALQMIGSTVVISNVKSTPPSVGFHMLTAGVKNNQGRVQPPLANSAACPATALSDTSVIYDQTATTAKFTFDISNAACFPLGFGCSVAGGSVTCDNSQMVWAYGDYSGSDLQQHSAQGGTSVNYLSGASSFAPVSKSFVAHATLMALSWGFLLPSGVIMARFFKGRQPPGWWFKMHRAMQSTGLLLAIAGFAVIVHHVQDTGGIHFGGAHSTHKIVGLFVMLIGIQQPLVAFFRPHPPAKGASKPLVRLLWEVAHKGLGYTGVVLGMINVITGLMILGDLYKSNPDVNVQQGLIFYIFVASGLVLTYLIMEAIKARGKLGMKTGRDSVVAGSSLSVADLGTENESDIASSRISRASNI